MLLAILSLVAIASAADPGLRIAGISVTPRAWDKKANLATFEQYARQAAAQGAQLILSPEGFLEGYVGNDKRTPDLTRAQYFAVGEPLDGPPLLRVAGLARELGVYLGIGFAESRGGRMYNSFVIFSPQGEAAIHYSKVHNGDDEPFNTTGVDFPVVSTPFGKWGALICYDRQLPETSRILAIKGAQLILVPSWGSYGEMNDAMMRTRAFENGVWVAFVHPKRCLFIDPGGRIVARDNGQGDQLVFATIHPSEAGRRGAIRSRKPALYRDILH
ncbi:MAG: Formamidase [Bryobacteraceae bacterium]|nr:Formamidase [Bryobacteraceae bacterium]